MEKDEFTYIRVKGVEDRKLVASILFANGYLVKPHTVKKGRSNEQYLAIIDVTEDKDGES